MYSYVNISKCIYVYKDILCMYRALQYFINLTNNFINYSLCLTIFTFSIFTCLNV